jgi:hypothetical protein
VRYQALATAMILACGMQAGAAVEMQIGSCISGFQQLDIDYKNNTPDPWNMIGFGVTIDGTRLHGAFDPVYNPISPRSSPRVNFASCAGHLGSATHAQLEAKLGVCNEPNPLAPPQSLRCSEAGSQAEYYRADLCLNDGLGIGSGAGFGGFLDSYRDQTQIQVAVPAACWQRDGKAVRFNPAASMGGSFYMMALVAVQEYLYVDMQFMLALGAETSGAGLVDSATGASLYQSPVNAGVDQAKYGAYDLPYLTVTGRLMPDYPKYFVTKDLKKLVATDGNGPTAGNSPQQLNSAFLAALNLWWDFDALKAAQDLCARQFLNDAKDKTAGIKLLLGAWFIGPNAASTSTTPSDDFATHVLPTTSAAILGADDATPYMKHFPWGAGTPDYDNTDYIARVFAALNPMAAANAQSTACGKALQVYDAGITLEDALALFYGQGGTPAAQGNGGLLWHFGISSGDRLAMWNELNCVFGKLKGKAPGRGAEEISYRYDFLTVLRAARPYLAGYLGKMSEAPTPPDPFNSEFTAWVSSHSHNPCARAIRDTTWPVMTLSDSAYREGKPLGGSFADDKGIRSYAYATDTSWRVWVDTDPASAAPSLAAGQRLWFRVTDSCGNAVIEEVKPGSGPTRAGAVAARPGRDLWVRGGRLGGAWLASLHPRSIAVFDALGVFEGWARPAGDGVSWTLPRGQGLLLEVRSSGGRRDLVPLPANP